MTGLVCAGIPGHLGITAGARPTEREGRAPTSEIATSPYIGVLDQHSLGSMVSDKGQPATSQTGRSTLILAMFSGC